MSNQTVTLYHNPRCSKSRAVRELLEQRELNLNIVHYLDNPPDSATLATIVRQLGLSARQLLRTGEALYREQKLDDPSLTEAQLLDAMAACPRLMERPIVVTAGKARIGRPPESVLEIIQ